MKARSKVVAATILVAAVWLLVLRTSAVPFGAFTREDLEPEQPPSADRPVLHRAQAPRAEATRPRSAVPTTVDTTPPTAETQHAKSLREKIRAFFIRFGQRFDLALGLRKNAADAEAFVDQLCAESRILRERPLFGAPEGYERDAAPFLVPLIGYEKPLDYPPGQLQLMDELRTHLKSYGSDWLTKITDQDLAGVDFFWMATLKQFDHWSMLGAGRLGDLPAGHLFRDPLLNYYDLTLWSKLRFAMGLRRGDLLAASAEVRHLADLMRSQRAIIAQLISVSIYRLDSRAREVALAAHLDVTDWQPVDLEQLERYRRVTFASLFFTYPGVAQGVVNKALACIPSPCTALVEGLAANRSFASHASTDNLQLLREAAVANHCEEALIARALLNQEFAPDESVEDAFANLGGRIPKVLNQGIFR